jgi:hypothetical protein
MNADLPSLDQLRSNAAECIRLAEAARTSQHKSLFIEMADRWLTLAEHAAREDRLNGGSLFRDRWVLNSYKKPIQQELEKFFIATDELEDKKLEIIGWNGPKVALKAIKKGSKSFARTTGECGEPPA